MTTLRSLCIALMIGWCWCNSAQAQVISGVCTNDGRPVKGLRIYVSGLTKPVVTNREGRYSATVVGPGNFTVTPYPSSSKIVAAPIRRLVNLSEGSVSGIDFELSRLDARAAIRGRILGADRRPVADAVVVMGGFDSLESDANGIYARSDIQPGRYSVTPMKRGMTFVPAVRSQNLVAGRVRRISVRGTPLSSGPTVPTHLSGVFDSRLRLASGVCPILPQSVEGRAVVYQKDRQARLQLPRLGYANFGVNSTGFSGAFSKRKLACVIEGNLTAEYSSPDTATVTGALRVDCLGTEQCNGTFSGSFTRR